jgi:hypothetical protein
VAGPTQQVKKLFVVTQLATRRFPNAPGNGRRHLGSAR